MTWRCWDLLKYYIVKSCKVANWKLYFVEVKMDYRRNSQANDASSSEGISLWVNGGFPGCFQGVANHKQWKNDWQTEELGWKNARRLPCFLPVSVIFPTVLFGALFSSQSFILYRAINCLGMLVIAVQEGAEFIEELPASVLSWSCRHFVAACLAPHMLTAPPAHCIATPPFTHVSYANDKNSTPCFMRFMPVQII